MGEARRIYGRPRGHFHPWASLEVSEAGEDLELVLMARLAAVLSGQTCRRQAVVGEH